MKKHLKNLTTVVFFFPRVLASLLRYAVLKVDLISCTHVFDDIFVIVPARYCLMVKKFGDHQLRLGMLVYHYLQSLTSQMVG